jgi:hypothetical protein
MLSLARTLGLGLTLATLLPAAAASAQPYGRGWEQQGSRIDAVRSAGQLADDTRDLRRFQNTAMRFDAAMMRGDFAGAGAALNSFLMQGRMEVEEQRRETAQAGREVVHSQREAWRDRTFQDASDARDDRRDFARERMALMQESAALRDLEQAAASASMHGMQPHIAQAARSAMQRFIQLANAEVYRTQRELREDARELREDRAARFGARPLPSPYRRF